MNARKKCPGSGVGPVEGLSWRCPVCDRIVQVNADRRVRRHYPKRKES